MERDGTWHMAPAYDLTWSQGPGGEHSSSVLGHGKDITRTHLIDLGKKADMKEQDIAEVIERTQAAISRWKKFANEYGVGSESFKNIAESLAKVRFWALFMSHVKTERL